jgi:hypothetical protein
MTKKRKIRTSAFASRSSPEKDRNTGMALTLLCLLVFLLGPRNPVWILLAVALLAVSMTFPTVLRPLAIAWYGLSGLLGSIVSRILLSLIFAFVVCPVALVRRALGKDDLLLKQFKKGSASVLQTRNRRVTAGDLGNPF